MRMEVLPEKFSVLKVADGAALFVPGTMFAARTDGENSLVCETRYAPAESIAREDGWRAFRVCGQLDFALVGVLAEIAGALAAEGISVFCVSTFDTDYVLVKQEKLNAAVEALAARGHLFSNASPTAD